MDFKLELVLVPVKDVDRAKTFYVETAGFHLDVDHRGGESFRVVQLTPPGSACSISIGIASYRSRDKAAGDVIRRADEQLYEAKREGKNRYAAASAS